MKKLITITTLIFAVIFILPESLLAQNGGFAGSATRIGFGPRAMAMGNAYGAVTTEGIYSYYNPALVSLRRFYGRQIDLSASTLQFDRVYQTASVRFEVPPTAGLSLALIRTGVNDIEERSLSGYPLGSFNLSEYQLLTSFGVRLSDELNAGISFKLNFADYHPDLTPATAVGVDLGILYLLNPNLTFGLVVQDLFASYTWNSENLYSLSQAANVVNEFPTRYKAALAWQNETFTIGTEFEVQSYTSQRTISDFFINNENTPTVIETTEEIRTSSGIFRIGGAWQAHERFTLRSGYRIMDTNTAGSGSFSAGFSIHLPFDLLTPSIDYAYVAEPYRVANMHVFALRLHL